MTINIEKPTVEKCLHWITAVGVVLSLWLNQNYVTRSEFISHVKEDENRVRKIEEVLIRMEDDRKDHVRFDSLLADHESRIRLLERAKP